MTQMIILKSLDNLMMKIIVTVAVAVALVVDIHLQSLSIKRSWKSFLRLLCKMILKELKQFYGINLVKEIEQEC